MSTTPSTVDAFARVRAALLAVWPTVADAMAGPTRAEFGRLLDECGSDHRPLVELVLDLGRVVRPVLAALPPQSPSTWVHVRAPLVHRIVSTRYLQPDVARWAVDVWGRALGVAPPDASASPALAHGDPAVDERVDGARPRTAAGLLPVAGAAPSAGTPRPLPRPPVLTPQQVPAAMRQRPSWAGGPVSFGVGQRPSQAGLAALAQSGRVVVRGPVASGPMFQPVERRAAVVMGLLLVLISGGLMRSFSRRPDVTTPVDALPTGTGPVAPVPRADTSASAMVGEVADSLVALASPDVPAPTGDSLMPASDPLVTGSAAVRDQGVGGAYLVEQRVRDVSGSASCDAVTDALAGGRASREVVSHRPGASTFTLVTRGVSGTLDADGQFVSEPRVGTTNNVQWRFVMRGRFHRDGFTGESVTYTDAILRWGKLQTCVVTADLMARRLP